jgi:hypothetical protein
MSSERLPKLTEQEYRDLSTAILLYTQRGIANWPQSDRGAIAKEFGEDKAADLIDRINRLEAEMWSISVDWNMHSLGSAADFKRDEMKKRYPELSADAVEALAWKLSFENR